MQIELFLTVLLELSFTVVSKASFHFSLESNHPFQNPFLYNPPCSTRDDCNPDGVCVSGHCRCPFGSVQTYNPNSTTRLECTLYHCVFNTACRYNFGLETYCDKRENLCRCQPETYFDEHTQSCRYNRNIFLLFSNTNKVNCTTANVCTARFGPGSYCSNTSGECQCLPSFWFSPAIQRCIQITDFKDDPDDDEKQAKDYTLFWLLIPGMAFAIIYRMFPHAGRRQNRRPIPMPVRSLPTFLEPDTSIQMADLRAKYARNPDFPPSYQDAVSAGGGNELARNSTVSNEITREVTQTTTIPEDGTSPPAYSSLTAENREPNNTSSTNIQAADNVVNIC